LGFTLVELLVVIGIILVLMALVFPLISSAKFRAYEADCQSNLRQIGTALYNFATSTDGYFPVATAHDGNQGPLVTALAQYFPTNSPAWFCKTEAKKYSREIKNGPTNGTIGYFYWSWVSGGAVDSTTTSNAWTQNISFGAPLNRTNISGAVLMSDRFIITPEQYHAGTKFNTGLRLEGSHVLMSGGSVKKISPIAP
jgi:prepilin-type N-terminal cleavage/methylation domain-containing protein